MPFVNWIPTLYGNNGEPPLKKLRIDSVNSIITAASNNEEPPFKKQRIY